MKLQFDTDNAAFAPDTGDLCGESARILREIADKLERGEMEGRIHDINGNRVGEWSL